MLDAAEVARSASAGTRLTEIVRLAYGHALPFFHRPTGHQVHSVVSALEEEMRNTTATRGR